MFQPMLSPIARPSAAIVAAIMLGQARDGREGFFGDRDASPGAGSRRPAPGCGLFGRIGDPPSPRGSNEPDDRPQAPAGRA